jgi:hypothetical protein
MPCGGDLAVIRTAHILVFIVMVLAVVLIVAHQQVVDALPGVAAAVELAFGATLICTHGHMRKENNDTT